MSNKNEVAVVRSEVMGVESRNISIPDFKGVNLGDEPRRLKISEGSKKQKKVKSSIKLLVM